MSDTKFKDALLNAVTIAIEDKHNVIQDFLNDAFDLVVIDEYGSRKATINVPVTIRCTRSNPGGYSVDAKLKARKIETVIGEGHCSYDPDQPELPNIENPINENDSENLYQEEKGAMKCGADLTKQELFTLKNAFYDAVCGREVSDGTRITDVMLNDYFSASDRWGSFDLWIKTGNLATARDVIRDESESASFAELVFATLN